MKTEISAGGIVVRKIEDHWEALLISDMNSQWTFPKGLVEKGEDTRAAATREIAEEVGLTQLREIHPLTPIHYTYQRDGLIQKTVHYFIFETETDQELVPQQEEGISKAEWVTLKKAKEMVGYPETNIKLIDQVLSFLASQG